MQKISDLVTKEVSRLSRVAPPRPLQPEEHESKCPCNECEIWAYALLDWEQDEVKAGRDPWAEFR